MSNTTSNTWFYDPNLASLARIVSIGIISVIAIIFNSFCIFMFIKVKKLIRLNLVYVISLSVFNIIKIIIEFLFPFLELVSNHVLTKTWCSVRYSLKYTSGEICSWILILISIERILILRKKKPSPNISNKSNNNNSSTRKSILMVVVLIVAFSALNSMVFFLNTMKSYYNEASKVNKCSGKLIGVEKSIYSDGSLNYSFMTGIYSLVYSFIPFFILIATNLIIFRILAELRSLNSKLIDKKLKEVGENAKILLILSFLFIITSLPTQIAIIASDIYANNKPIYNIFNLLYYIFIIIESFNNCFSVIIIILVNKRLYVEFSSYVRKILGAKSFLYKK
jgi:hypothetical protein